MKKLMALLLTIALMATSLALTACNSFPTEPEQNDFEFWIGDSGENIDYSKYDSTVDAYMGPAVSFYGSHYSVTETADGKLAPTVYVRYTVSNYPDCVSKKRVVTGIEITDPTVELYGLTTNSSQQQFKAEMEKQGYKVEPVGTAIKAVKGKITVVLGKVNVNDVVTNSLSIWVEVTNKTGIMY